MNEEQINWYTTDTREPERASSIDIAIEDNHALVYIHQGCTSWVERNQQSKKHGIEYGPVTAGGSLERMSVLSAMKNMKRRYTTTDMNLNTILRISASYATHVIKEYMVCVSHQMIRGKRIVSGSLFGFRVSKPEPKYSIKEMNKMNKDATEMKRYMNRPDVYQSGRIYSPGIVEQVEVKDNV